MEGALTESPSSPTEGAYRRSQTVQSALVLYLFLERGVQYYCKSVRIFPGLAMAFRSIGHSSKVLVFLFLFVTLQYGNSAGNDEINVGAILDLNTFPGKEAKVALELAAQDINQNATLMNGTVLNLHIQHCGGTGPTAVLEVFRNQVVAIVVQSPDVSKFVAPVAEALQVPLLALHENAGHAGYYSTSGSRYMLSMPPNDSEDYHQMQAMAALVKYFHWKEVVVIFQEDEFWLNGVSILSDELQLEDGIKISQMVAVPFLSDQDSIGDILSQMMNNTGVRAFIVHTSPELGVKIFREADKLDLMDEGFAWVVTERIATFLDYLDSSAIGSMQGIVGVRRQVSWTSEIKNVERRWKRSFPRVNLIGIYAYKSLWVIASAIKALLDHRNRMEYTGTGTMSNVTEPLSLFKGGHILVEYIRSIKSMSDSLPIYSKHDSRMNTYEIINMAGRSYRTAGFWTERDGFFRSEKQRKLSSTKNLSDIIWPGGSAKVPVGYRTLVIGVPQLEVFTEFISVTKDGKQFSGFCIDMFEAAVKQLPYDLPYEYRAYRKGDTSAIYDELIGQVVNKRFDAVVGDITILEDRTSLVDFTQPYTDSRLVLMVPLKRLHHVHAWSFLHPFTLNLWLIGAAFFMLTSFLIWLLERKKNEDFRGRPTKQVVTSLSFSVSTLVFAQKEKVMSSLGRFILGTWLLVVFILSNSYTANLASILTVAHLTPSITKMESLTTSPIKVGYLNGSYVGDFLKDELKISEHRLVPLNSPEDYSRNLSDGNIGAIVDEIPYVQLVMSVRCGKFAVVDQAFGKGGFGFIFAKGSPFTSDFSTAVLNITEQRAVVESIRNKWFGDSNSCSAVDALIDSKTESLSPTNLVSLFVLTASTYFLCASIYLGRVFYGHKQCTRENPEPNTTQQLDPVGSIDAVMVDDPLPVEMENCEEGVNVTLTIPPQTTN